MNTIITKITIAALLSGFSLFAVAGEMKDASTGSAKENKIEIKDFAFNPQNITVKSGEKRTWINRDEEPHTVVSVGKQFKKSPGLDTDQTYTIVAGAPGTYSFPFSGQPEMTRTMILPK